VPLRIQDEGGLDRPVVICDLCGAEITDALDGNFQWAFDDEGRLDGGEVYFTHKRCCHAFEQSNGGGGACWGAIGLECLPIYLGANLRLNWPAAARTAAWLATPW
jgi:hypothetical protein